MSLWPIEPLDPATAPDGDLAGLHALETALEGEALPGEPVALGRWLKAVNALRLLDERTAVEFIHTRNAGSNGAMLGINVAMGFRPLENRGGWQVPVKEAAAAVARRRRLEAS